MSGGPTAEKDAGRGGRPTRYPRRQYDPDHCDACGDFLPCGKSWLDDEEQRTDAAERMNQSAANRGRGY